MPREPKSKPNFSVSNWKKEKNRCEHAFECVDATSTVNATITAIAVFLLPYPTARRLSIMGRSKEEQKDEVGRGRGERERHRRWGRGYGESGKKEAENKSWTDSDKRNGYRLLVEGNCGDALLSTFWERTKANSHITSRILQFSYFIPLSISYVVCRMNERIGSGSLQPSHKYAPKI